MSIFSSMGAFPWHFPNDYDTGDEMKNDDKNWKKMLTATNDPRPTHCVELPRQEPLVTQEFDKDRARIRARFKKYQEAIENFRKTHK